MPIFMYQFKYTPKAWAGFVKKPEDRGALVDELLKNLGGRLISIYYTAGEWDGLVIYEATNEIKALASVITIVAPGHLAETHTTVLYTMIPDVMNAMKMAKMLRFRGMPRGLPLEEPPPA